VFDFVGNIVTRVTRFVRRYRKAVRFLNAFATNPAAYSKGIQTSGVIGASAFAVHAVGVVYTLAFVGVVALAVVLVWAIATRAYRAGFADGSALAF
jgi:hypothetical protein